jgi:hypothetical protein
VILRALGTLRRLLARLPRHSLRELAVFGFFVAVSIAMTWPYAIRLRTRLPDVGIDDPLLYTRFTYNVHEFLLGRRAGLFDFDFFFPSLLAGTTNDPALGAAALTFPLRAFTDDYLLMVNLATLASFPLTAHATYVLTRRLTRSRGAGIVAGVAFAFCFFRIAQLDHVNVLQTAWLPYALAAILRYVEASSRRNQIVLALALFAAGAGSHNLALYAAPVVPTFALAALWSVRRGSRWRVALGMIAPASVAAIALIPIYAPYRLAQGA